MPAETTETYTFQPATRSVYVGDKPKKKKKKKKKKK